ncbi:MAG: hypothetical protein JW741_08555 [Sedimentisphaerales bacterium]|nr:hypothetical protein [Sedimentisphaerales bacterium]
MGKTRLLSLAFLREFQNRDEFFEKLTDEQGMLGKIGNQAVLLVAFSGIYGVIMGSYNSVLQAVSSGVKVPLLFSLSLLVCFPAFFILQHVLGSKLGLWQMLTVILSGFVMISLIMAAFAPIVLFFLITGGNYAFLKLLHVAIFAVASLFGMKTILDGLKFCCEKQNVYPKIGVTVFRFWILILAFVGMQLAWNLRPFIGSRGLPFEVIRQREGNFYLAVVRTAANLVEAGTAPVTPPEPNLPTDDDGE